MALRRRIKSYNANWNYKTKKGTVVLELDDNSKETVSPDSAAEFAAITGALSQGDGSQIYLYEDGNIGH